MLYLHLVIYQFDFKSLGQIRDGLFAYSIDATNLLKKQHVSLQAGRVITDLFALCPNAKAATEVATEEIEKVMQTLGLQKKRAVMIQRFSQEYLEEGWTHVTQLHGVGK